MFQYSSHLEEMFPEAASKIAAVVRSALPLVSRIRRLLATRPVPEAAQEFLEERLRLISRYAIVVAALLELLESCGRQSPTLGWRWRL